MKTIVRNPSSGVYAATPDYIHAIEVQSASRMLFVSGTMGLDPQGAPGKISPRSSTSSGRTSAPSWRAPT